MGNRRVLWDSRIQMAVIPRYRATPIDCFRVSGLMYIEDAIMPMEFIFDLFSGIVAVSVVEHHYSDTYLGQFPSIRAALDIVEARIMSRRKRGW